MTKKIKKIVSVQQKNSIRWRVTNYLQIPNFLFHLKRNATKYGILALGASITNSMLNEQTTSSITSLTGQVSTAKYSNSWLIVGASAEEISETMNAQDLLRIEFPNPTKVEEIDFSEEGIYKRRIVEIEGEIDLSKFKNLRKFGIFRDSQEKKPVTIKNFPLSLKSLDVSKNVNLIDLDCSENKLSEINVGKCSKLTILRCQNNEITELNLKSNEIREINCENNRLTDLKFLVEVSHPEKVSSLILGNNKFPPQRLDIFSRFINLKTLKIGNNQFYGSLKPLEILTKLEELDISRTNIDSGLEYLPESIEYLNCNSEHSDRRVTKLQEQLRPFNYNVKKWKLVNVLDYTKRRERESTQTTATFSSKAIDSKKEAKESNEQVVQKKSESISPQVVEELSVNLSLLSQQSYNLIDYYNLDYREEMIDNYLSLLQGWLGRLGEVPEIREEIYQLQKKWKNCKQNGIDLQEEIGEQFWKVLSFDKKSYREWAKRREEFRRQSNKYSRKNRENSPYKLGWFEAREMIWKEIVTFKSELNYFLQIRQEAERWLEKQKNGSLKLKSERVESNLSELRKEEQQVLRFNFTDFLVIILVLHNHRKLQQKLSSISPFEPKRKTVSIRLVSMLRENPIEKENQRLGVKLHQLKQPAEEQSEATKWDSIKTSMEKEKEENIDSLVDGGYWDKQIQNLQDGELPLNKKQVTLQTRRRNHYSRLKVKIKTKPESSQLSFQIVQNSSNN